jgi:DNA-damage-inducible protein D
MHHAVFQSLTVELNSLRHLEGEHEYWHARDLMDYYRFPDWRSFEAHLAYAQSVCSRHGQAVESHFRSVTRPGPDLMDTPEPEPDMLLTAYAGFLLAKQLDPAVTPVRFALNYFPAFDRTWQALALRMYEWERLTAREKLRREERRFSGIVFQYLNDGEGMGLLKSSGDEALFGYSTREMKSRLRIPRSQPLTDFLPAATLRAKLFAEEQTVKALKSNPRRTEEELVDLYREKNLKARQIMLEEWIYPEFLPVLDDIDHVETRFRKDLQRVARLELPDLASPEE